MEANCVNMIKRLEELGKCPDCRSKQLEYGAIEPDDTYTIYYPVKCKDCGYEGKEIYSLEFLKYERDS